MGLLAIILLQTIAFAKFAFSQTVVQVTVGDEGSFFTPQIATVLRNGDMISFRWTGMFHSVTQSSFEDPCTPLKGGFDSGVTGNPPNEMIDPEWNLTITDVSQPIWFFCKMTVPVSHCTSGMVGAINAVSTGTNNSFDIFLQRAKSLTNPPSLPHNATPSLTGVGASALSTPVPLFNLTNSNSSTLASSATTTSSSSTLASSSVVPSQTASAGAVGLTTAEKGGIAGGIIGAILVTLIIVLAVLSFCRARKYKRDAMIANQMLRNKEAETDFVKIGRQVPPGHRVAGSNVSMTETTDGDVSAATNGFNMKELAAEIAKNIRQEGDSQGGAKSARMRRAVPEDEIAESLSGGYGERNRFESMSTPPGTGTESNRSQGRQLPRPPPKNSRRPLTDDFSVETLPAYPR